jgi:RNA polymerase sigma-70 factor (ECF subfamily)
MSSNNLEKKVLMQDLELINQLKSGDEESFRIVVETYQKQVLNSCYRFVLNRETAEDLTQDVFIEVYRSIKMFKGDSKLSTWIYRIAISKSLDYLKSRKRKKRFAKVTGLSEVDEPAEQLKASAKNHPENIIEQQERLKVLSIALNKLPDNQRIAFTLSKYDEMSYREIADVLAVSISSVESLIHRAKMNLKNYLYKYYKKNL